MSKVFSLISSQLVPADLHTVWDFFSNAANLLTITPPFLNLKVTNEIFDKEVYAGQIVTYTVKPLLGIPMSWMTEITHVESGKYFVDEQRKGPYKLWHHQHHFVEVDGNTQMTDIVHYRLPLGLLGNIANEVIVKNKLNEIFSYRFKKIVEVFGTVQGQTMKISIK